MRSTDALQVSIRRFREWQRKDGFNLVADEKFLDLRFFLISHIVRTDRRAEMQKSLCCMMAKTQTMSKVYCSECRRHDKSPSRKGDQSAALISEISDGFANLTLEPSQRSVLACFNTFPAVELFTTYADARIPLIPQNRCTASASLSKSRICFWRRCMTIMLNFGLVVALCFGQCASPQAELPNRRLLLLLAD